MQTLLATCDRVLARLPLSESESNIQGGIIIPKVTLEQMRSRTIVKLAVLSAGPDCKTVKTGDEVVVNSNVCSPIEFEGAEYMVFSEVSVIMCIKLGCAQAQD